MTRARAAAWAIVPTAALLALNGLYLEAAFAASPALFWLLDALQFALVPLASLWVLARFAGVRPRDYGLGRLDGGQGAVAAVLVFALSIVVFVYGYGLARVLTLSLPWEWPASAFLYPRAMPRNVPGALAVLAYLVVSTALVEEIVFRGLPALCLPARLYPAVSAALYALIHWESGTREVVATLLLGVVLAGLYLRVRNLWPFVAGHAVNEMLAFTGTYGY